MTVSLPPRYVSAPVPETYDRNLSDAYFRTLIQIRGLAWRTKGEHTPPMSIEELMAIRGLERSQMFAHLRYLRQNGYIRTEPLTGGLFVVYPLRWEPGAAFPTDARMGDLSPEEVAALFGEDTNPENRTGSPINRTQHVHVVVDSSLHEEQQQHVIQSDFPDSLVERVSAVFLDAGADLEQARASALALLTARGEEVCERQLGYFERRCELARASARGLGNPAGLFLASVEGDWTAPNGREPERRHWFTDEEAAMMQADVERKLAELEANVRAQTPDRGQPLGE